MHIGMKEQMEQMIAEEEDEGVNKEMEQMIAENEDEGVNKDVVEDDTIKKSEGTF